MAETNVLDIASGDPQIDAARLLYVMGINPSFRDIGEKVGVSHETIRNWKKKYNWELDRQAYWNKKNITHAITIDKANDAILMGAAGLSSGSISQHIESLKEFNKLEEKRRKDCEASGKQYIRRVLYDVSETKTLIDIYRAASGQMINKTRVDINVNNANDVVKYDDDLEKMEFLTDEEKEKIRNARNQDKLRSEAIDAEFSTV